MDTKKIVAIIVVVVIVVAAVGAAIALTGSDDNGPTTHNYGGDLLVYGNANEDSVIDENDIAYIQAVIDGTETATEFCDANHDGKIDENDIAQVRSMIAREDGLTVWYIDGMGSVNTVTWPLNTFVVLANSPQLMALAIGLDNSRILMYSKADSVLFQSFTGATLNENASLSDFESITGSGVPDAVIVGNSDSNLTNNDIMSLYVRAGIDIIPVVGMDGEESASSALTLGYLCDCEEQAREYAQWCNDMLDEIERLVATMPADQRKTGLTWFGGFAAAGYDNDYTKAMEAAGGVAIADWSGWQRLDADNSTWILNYDPDCIIRIYTMGYGASDSARVSVYETYANIIAPMRAYQEDNFVLIDFTLPQTLRIAYMAEFMYPEVFGEGFADEWHQKLVDIYGFDYEVDGQFMITADYVDEYYGRS